MANQFSGINMMSQALRNFQRALQTSGNNVANVNTPGYSRQRVEFGSREGLPFYQNGWIRLGEGAVLEAVTRARDGFLERSSNNSLGNLGKFGMAATGLGSIEGVFGEPGDTGISSALGKFFDAWSGLGSNPSDPGAKFQVRNAGQVLADRLRGAWSELDRQSSTATDRIEATIREVNDLAKGIDALNKAVREASVGGSAPNELLDQRDQLVAQMSGLVDVQVERFKDGTFAVYAAGFTVVDSAGTMEFPSDYDAVAGTLTNGTFTKPVRNGELAGLFLTYATVSSNKAKLDSLANALRSEVNVVHTTGVNGSSTTNVRFFNDVAVPPQTGAIDFDLDDAIKADVENVMSGVSGRPGDGGLALSLAAMRDTAQAALGTRTFGGFTLDAVDTVANSRAYYDKALATETSVHAQIQNQIQAVSGVSVDDEMAEMVQFQRSYQAAAKTLSVLDQMTQDLIDMLQR